MSTLCVRDARSHLSDVIARAETEAVFVERRGPLAAVVISPAFHERTRDVFEGAEDVAAFDDATAEEGAPFPGLRSRSSWAGADPSRRAATRQRAQDDRAGRPNPPAGGRLMGKTCRRETFGVFLVSLLIGGVTLLVFEPIGQHRCSPILLIAGAECFGSLIYSMVVPEVCDDA